MPRTLAAADVVRVGVLVSLAMLLVGPLGLLGVALAKLVAKLAGTAVAWRAFRRHLPEAVR